MEVSVIIPNVVHINYDTQYECCSAFVRIQEFYESPINSIAGKYFTLEKFMDEYVKYKGAETFTYFTDWAGFNVTGDAFVDFEKKFKGKMTEKERKIFTEVKNQISKKDYHEGDFYVIATFDSPTFGYEDNLHIIDHEVAHALFYLDGDYQYRAEMAIKKLFPPKTLDKLKEKLRLRGYAEHVMLDEINAYFSTEHSALCEEKYTKQAKILNKLYWEQRNKHVVG